MRAKVRFCTAFTMRMTTLEALNRFAEQQQMNRSRAADLALETFLRSVGAFEESAGCTESEHSEVRV